ncbi:MAG: helix-turn-helix domain-containing protein, partial [Acholeplasmataceae bacterium]|nr:helix-turn-helix domain-containing protein [Acholeplasmataceae bacterium]
MEFKDRLNQALSMRKMSAAELARVSGVNEGAISQYRKGGYKANQYNLEKMAKALNISIPWLMGADVDGPLLFDKMDFQKGGKIPVLGRVVAGIPVEAVTDVIDYEEIAPELAATGDFFALKIKGDSMTPRICENDVVIVRKQPSVDSGSLAIVLINGEEATIKQVIMREDGIMLQAFNPAIYPTHFYTCEDIKKLPVTILGKV